MSRHRPTAESVMRISRTENGHNTVGSPIYSNGAKKKWSNWLPIFVAFVFISEIAFLGRLDVTKNVDLLNSWAHSFYQFTADGIPYGGDDRGFTAEHDRSSDYQSCEDWLDREDSVTYSRDFDKDPILVRANHQVRFLCINLHFYFNSSFTAS